MEGPARSGQRDLLRPGASAGAVGGVGFHGAERLAGDDPRRAVSAFALSLRVDAFELGACDALFFGELRQSEHGAAECPVGVRGGPRASSHRLHDVGGASRRCGGEVHGQLPGLAGTLRPDAGSDQSVQRSRKRRRGVGAWAPQRGRRSVLALAWQPGFCQPCGVRRLARRLGEQAQCSARRQGGRRAGLLTAPAGRTVGNARTHARARQSHEYDSGQAQHLLGAGAVHRRGSGGAHRHGGDRGLVRAALGPAAGAFAWPGQTSRRLPAHHRLAGA